MKTITMTEDQFTELVRAVETSFDINNDTVLDDIWISDKVTAVTRQEVMAMRAEVSDKLNSLVALTELRTLLQSMS